MAKVDIDTNDDVLLADVNRYNELAFKLSKSSAEQTELSGLQSTLADYLLIASDYNDLVTQQNTNTGDISENGVNTNIIRTAKTTTGASNVYVVNTDGTFDLTKDGNILPLNPNHTNTGASTVVVDTHSAKSIKKWDEDSEVYISVEADDIGKNVPMFLRWDLSEDFFVLAPYGGVKINTELTQFEIASSSGAIVAGDLISIIDGKATNVVDTKHISITANANSNFDLGDITSQVVVALDDSRVLLVYIDTDDSNASKMTILTIDGFTISKGASYELSIYTVSYLSGAKVDTDRVILAYNADSVGYVRALSISDTVITLGSESSVNGNRFTGITTSIVEVDTNKAVLVYVSALTTETCMAMAMTVSGTIITKGTPSIAIDSNYSQWVSAVKLDTNKIAVFCRMYQPEVSGGSAVVTTLYGLTIVSTAGPTFVTGDIDYISSANVTTDKALMCYRNDALDNKGYVQVVTCSGTTLTINNTFNYASLFTVLNSSMVMLDSNYAVIAFIASNSSSKPMYILLNVGTTSVTEYYPYNIDTSSAVYLPMVDLGNGSALVVPNLASNAYPKVLKLSNRIDGISTKNGVSGDTIGVYDLR